MCQVSCFPFHVFRVVCHMSPATAKDPPPANSPILHSMLVYKDQTNQKQIQNNNKKKLYKLQKHKKV